MSNRISQSFEHQMRADLDRVERQMLVRWCVTLAVGFGALFAALHYWPPHG